MGANAPQQQIAFFWLKKQGPFSALPGAPRVNIRGHDALLSTDFGVFQEALIRQLRANAAVEMRLWAQRYPGSEKGGRWMGTNTPQQQIAFFWLKNAVPARG